MTADHRFADDVPEGDRIDLGMTAREVLVEGMTAQEQKGMTAQTVGAMHAAAAPPRPAPPQPADAATSARPKSEGS